MLGLPWWGWIVLAVVAVVVFGVRAARGWRASFRRQFVEYLRREAPEFEVVAERDRELDIRGPGGSTGTLSLERVFSEGTDIPPEDVAAREELFSRFVKMLREGKSVESLDPERDRARVRPRLVPAGYFADAVRRGAKAEPVSVPSGVPGLSIALVLDSETSVAYLTADMLGELGLTTDEALALAKANLAGSVDVAAIVRDVLEKNALVMVKSFDSYDAARVLLVPAALAEGQELAAVIPDRDTLGLTRPPADGDWSKLRQLARTPAGDVLWEEPLRVTADGIRAV